MNHTLIKISAYIFMTLVIAALFFAAPGVHAAELFLQSNTQAVHIGQEFAVDVMLDPENQNINAISLAVSIPQNFTFVRSLDNDSIVPTWISRASVSGNAVRLSGIVPGGFSGLIDPRSPKNILPGRVVRLILKATNAGAGMIEIKDAQLLVHDGAGSAATVRMAAFPIRADAKLVPKEYAINDTVQPVMMMPIIVQDENLFDGHLTVLFDASDQGSGIEHFEVKENLLTWRVATSPYKLRQPYSAFSVLVKAVDQAGNQTVTKTKLPNAIRIRSFAVIALLATVAIVFAYAIIRKALKRHENLS